MSKDFDYSVKLKAGNTGSAVLIKQDGEYYLLTAAHVGEGSPEDNTVIVTCVDGSEHMFDNLNRVVSPKKGGADVCVMKLPIDVAITVSENVKCATFEGSGFPCEIDGYPSNASDKRIRIETGCHISKETEVGDALYVKYGDQRTDGLKMEDVENGFSGSGVFVDSNGEKYLIGIVYRVEDSRNLFIGWKMQKINEILRGEGWKEIPLIPIELRQRIIEQYNNLIHNRDFVLSRIKNSIIGRVQLPRTAYKKKVGDAISKNNIIIITGDAGIGKSALAKEVLSDPKFKSVAIVGDDLDEEDDNSILAHWRINDKLQDLFKSPIWGEGEKVLLVESAERMLNGNTDTAIVFLEDLIISTPNLKLVFTIRKNSLNLFRISLQANGIFVPEKNVIDIGLLDDEELKVVEKAIPSVGRFMPSDKTREILKNPFYLNLACSIAITTDIESLRGSEFKDQLCKQIVSGKKHDARLTAQRVEALVAIARQTSKVGMNLVKCEMTDAVCSLVQDDVLVGDIETGYMRPGHDILTDWGLYRYIDDIFHEYESKKISLVGFYENLDKNIASRNMFRQYIEAHITEEYPNLDSFISESLSLSLDDFIYDDLFYAILISDKGSSFLASIKQVLLRNSNSLLKRIANALSYMFRKVDWNIKEYLMKSGVIEDGSKIRNSDYMLPSGRGWYTFITFLYENRDVFKALRKDLIPLLLQCELVSFTEKEAPNLKQYVFSLLSEDVASILSDDEVYGKPDKEVIRILFKWMDENPELIRSWVEKSLTADSHKFDVIKEFLLLSETFEALGFIYNYPDLYKSLIRKEWFGKEGFVRDYYPMIHQASGMTTTYKCFLYSHYVDAVVFLCELLNEDIKKNNQFSHLEEIKVTLDGKQVSLLGNDYLWREYRGRNYQSHVRESLLMSFEKWLMDAINNNIKDAPHAESKENLLAVFKIVYENCINVSAWGVLASVATRFPIFVGMAAMPIYSCRDFILWDKTRYSSELMQPMISPHASKAVRKEVAESYNLPHRKKDLEGVILQLSCTEGFAEEFKALVKHYKETATTYMEKVSAGRMDINQYEIIGKTDEGYLIQGKPSDDIKEEAEEYATIQEVFNQSVKTSNLARQRYEDNESHDISEWRDFYANQKEQRGLFDAKGLVASLGVKKYWKDLDKKEKRWCRNCIIEENLKYVTTGQFQVYSEYSSEGLLYLLDKTPKDKEVFVAILYLIDAIGDNDTIFQRFEIAFKNLIWKNHKDLADRIIIQYLNDSKNKRDDVDKFAHICKLVPTDVEDNNIDKMATAYCNKYFKKWSEVGKYPYTMISDTRIDTFCAEYMVAMPLKRRKFIESIWLESSNGISGGRHSISENPIASIFNHFCYVATKENKDDFWKLWEIMFEWYKAKHAEAVLSSLMLHFELLRPNLLNNWEVMDESAEHINKLLSILPLEGLPYLSRLVCRVGFKSLMPECLRYIDNVLLRKSAAEKNDSRRWQDAIEDLYDDAKTRDAIKRDEQLRVAYVEVLNGLISNGSAIAYMIRDYYI